jgi:hypothetical protein
MPFFLIKNLLGQANNLKRGISVLGIFSRTKLTEAQVCNLKENKTNGSAAVMHYSYKK